MLDLCELDADIIIDKNKTIHLKKKSYTISFYYYIRRASNPYYMDDSRNKHKDKRYKKIRLYFDFDKINIRTLIKEIIIDLIGYIGNEELIEKFYDDLLLGLKILTNTCKENSSPYIKNNCTYEKLHIFKKNTNQSLKKRSDKHTFNEEFPIFSTLIRVYYYAKYREEIRNLRLSNIWRFHNLRIKINVDWNFDNLIKRYNSYELRYRVNKDNKEINLILKNGLNNYTNSNNLKDFIINGIDWFCNINNINVNEFKRSITALNIQSFHCAREIIPKSLKSFGNVPKLNKRNDNKRHLAFIGFHNYYISIDFSHGFPEFEIHFYNHEDKPLEAIDNDLEKIFGCYTKLNIKEFYSGITQKGLEFIKIYASKMHGKALPTLEELENYLVFKNVKMLSDIIIIPEFSIENNFIKLSFAKLHINLYFIILNDIENEICYGYIAYLNFG